MILELLLATTLQQRVEMKVQESLPRVLEMHKQQGLEYESLPRFVVTEYGNMQAATYSPQDNVIYFNIRTDVVDEQTIVDAVPQNLSHELAHKQTEERISALAGRLVTDRDAYRALPQEERLAQFLTIEGIGAYYESLISPVPHCDPCISPRNVHSWIEHFDAGIMDPYLVGHALVKPILDGFGTNGFDYLVMFPPTGKDIEDLRAYQCKALGELEKARIKL